MTSSFRVPDFSKVYAAQRQAIDFSKLYAAQRQAIDFSKLYAAQRQAIDFSKLYETQLKTIDFSKLYARQLQAIDFSKVYAAQLQAIDFSKLYAAQLKTIDFSKLFARQLQALDFSSRFISGLGLQEAAAASGIEELPEELTDPVLSRDQQRFIVGYFVYVMTWLIFLYFVLAVMNADNIILSGLAYLFFAMSGMSGVAIAKGARDLAYQAFDYLSPSEE